MGLEAYGSEITKSQIEYNERNGLKVIKLENLSKYSFDMINTEQVFEHLAEPYEVLKFLTKCLKPNGYLKISVPNSVRVKSNLEKEIKAEWFYAKGKRYSLNPLEPLQHLNGFTHHSLITMASRLGLKESNISIGRIHRNSVNSSSLINSIRYFLSPFLPIYDFFNSKRTNVLFIKS
tara:strand:- start:441 stop:971 length:531 start_codon:yes stop_codon:yes gene_type:complete